MVSKITELSQVEKEAMTRFDEHEIQIDAEIEKVEQNRREMVSCPMCFVGCNDCIHHRHASVVVIC